MQSSESFAPESVRPQVVVRLFSIEEAGRCLGISAWTVRHYLRTGKLEGIRIGRRRLIEAREIRRVIEEGRGE